MSAGAATAATMKLRVVLLVAVLVSGLDASTFFFRRFQGASPLLSPQFGRSFPGWFGGDLRPQRRQVTGISELPEWLEMLQAGRQPQQRAQRRVLKIHRVTVRPDASTEPEAPVPESQSQVHSRPGEVKGASFAEPHLSASTLSFQRLNADRAHGVIHDPNHEHQVVKKVIPEIQSQVPATTPYPLAPTPPTIVDHRDKSLDHHKTHVEETTLQSIPTRTGATQPGSPVGDQSPHHDVTLSTILEEIAHLGPETPADHPTTARHDTSTNGFSAEEHTPGLSHTSEEPTVFSRPAAPATRYLPPPPQKQTPETGGHSHLADTFFSHEPSGPRPDPFGARAGPEYLPPPRPSRERTPSSTAGPDLDQFRHVQQVIAGFQTPSRANPPVHAGPHLEDHPRGVLRAADGTTSRPTSGPLPRDQFISLSGGAPNSAGTMDPASFFKSFNEAFSGPNHPPSRGSQQPNTPGRRPSLRQLVKALRTGNRDILGPQPEGAVDSLQGVRDILMRVAGAGSPGVTAGAQQTGQQRPTPIGNQNPAGFKQSGATRGDVAINRGVIGGTETVKSDVGRLPPGLEFSPVGPILEGTGIPAQPNAPTPTADPREDPNFDTYAFFSDLDNLYAPEEPIPVSIIQQFILNNDSSTKPADTAGIVTAGTTNAAANSATAPTSQSGGLENTPAVSETPTPLQEQTIYADPWDDPNFDSYAFFSNLDNLYAPENSVPVDVLREFIFNEGPSSGVVDNSIASPASATTSTATTFTQVGSARPEAPIDTTVTNSLPPTETGPQPVEPDTEEPVFDSYAFYSDLNNLYAPENNPEPLQSFGNSPI